MKLVLVALLGAIIFVTGCVSNIPFLSGPPSFMTKCNSDSDCVAVCAAKTCCCQCLDVAINKRYEAEWNYANAKYCQLKNQSTCISASCDYYSKALCISGTCIVNKTAVR